jgi:hypothetical protein
VEVAHSKYNYLFYWYNLWSQNVGRTAAGIMDLLSTGRKFYESDIMAVCEPRTMASEKKFYIEEILSLNLYKKIQ